LVTSVIFHELTETHDAEHDRQNDEATELNRLAANGVDSSDSNPVARDGTSANQDQVADGDVVQDFVDAITLGITDGLQNCCVVETDTVESNVKEEPRAGSTEQDLSVLPLAVVVDEVAPGSLGDLHARCRVAHLVDTCDLIRNALRRGGKISLDIGSSLDNVAGDVKGVTGSLRNGQAVVESNATGNGTEADDHTPHLVNSDATDAAASADLGGSEERLLEADGDDERHDTSGELANTLHSEDRAHHSSTPLGGRKLRCDNGAERVVTSDTDCGVVSIADRIGDTHSNLLPMSTRQKMIVPTIDMPGESEERA
jgi:hypothetical protein